MTIWGSFPIMPGMEHLISEIKAYCEARGISTGTFGSYAVGDGKFMDRLERGGQCLPKTVEKVRDYMAANPPLAKAS